MRKRGRERTRERKKRRKERKRTQAKGMIRETPHVLFIVM